MRNAMHLIVKTTNNQLLLISICQVARMENGRF